LLFLKSTKGGKKVEEKIIKEEMIEGDIEFEGKLIFENACTILGDLRAKEIFTHRDLTADFIEVEKSIEVGGTLKVLESIRASGDIKVDWYLEADVSIKAKGSIRAGGAIKAGRLIKAKSIEAGRYIMADFLIQADQISAGKKAKKGETEFQKIFAREIRGKIVQGIP